MHKQGLLQKLAAGAAPKFETWALPKEKKFPIDTPELLKVAAAAFDDEREHMSPSQRLVCARHIVDRAHELGVSVTKSAAFKYASSRLSPHFRQFLALRKEATCHLADDDLDKLASIAEIFDSKNDVAVRVAGLDRVAAALEDFDTRHKLAGHWGAWMPDPAYSVFGPTADIATPIVEVVKVAGVYDVDGAMLSGADWEQLKGHLEPEIVDGLKKADDKLAVFASLPEPHKEIVYQTLFLREAA